jgi:hypothetical protein
MGNLRQAWFFIFTGLIFIPCVILDYLAQALRWAAKWLDKAYYGLAKLRGRIAPSVEEINARLP